MISSTKGILWAVLQAPLGVKPLYSNGSPHHITLQYGVRREGWAQWIGTRFTARAVAVCHNDRVQAVAFTMPSNVPCQNDNPHVTVSWVQGAAPVESNAMLAGTHHRQPLAGEWAFIVEFREWSS